MVYVGAWVERGCGFVGAIRIQTHDAVVGSGCDFSDRTGNNYFPVGLYDEAFMGIGIEAWALKARIEVPVRSNPELCAVHLANPGIL